MSKKMVIIAVAIIIISMSTIGCSQVKSDGTQFPFNLISPSYGMPAFEIPEEWDVFQVGQYFVIDEDKQLNDQVPLYVGFSFGKVAEENKIDIEMIQQIEEEQNSQSQTLYWVSEDERYAGLRALRTYNAEQLLHQTVQQPYFEIIELNINDKMVYGIYYDEKPPHAFMWVSNDNHFLYELKIEHAYRNALPEEKDKSIEKLKPILQKLTTEM